MSLWSALGTLGWRAWDAFTARARLRLEPIWEPGDIGRDGQVHLSFTAAVPALRVVNAGRRPIYVIEAGVVRRKRRWQWRKRAESILDLPGLPTTLAEGQWVQLWAGRWMTDPEVRTIVAHDSLGRRWKLPRRKINKFLEGPRPVDPE